MVGGRHHLVTGIKRTVVIWPTSSNHQIRRYPPLPPSQRDKTRCPPCFPPLSVIDVRFLLSSLSRHSAQCTCYNTYTARGEYLQLSVMWEVSQSLILCSELLLACLNLTFFISSLAHISSSKPHGGNYYYHIKCLQIFSNLELHVELNYKLLQW